MRGALMLGTSPRLPLREIQVSGHTGIVSRIKQEISVTVGESQLYNIYV